ncbi:MAG TPA: MobF family relaxase [Acidimicrobiales bacterium]|nr:MobF family relaxase [Acidimicrobiales bacterium]
MTTLYASSARDSALYYTHYLAQDGPEAEGVWLGRQATELGLDGAVATGDLEALLSGRHPATGVQLGTALVDRVGPKGKLIRAVAGFDATFSAPKSVSILWALTGDPGLVAAHDVAVRATLDYLERHGATTRVRVSGRRRFPDANGLTMAVFQQGTSREDDPQLHTHVVVSGKITAPDGRWMALDGRYLKKHQRALGGLYQSVLRAELAHRYGVAWEPIVNGQAEIAGTPAELLSAFSKRTAQVEALLERRVEAFCEREGRDPTRWERAAIAREAAEDSRATKSGAAVADLTDSWSEEARALGWTRDRLVAQLRTIGREAPAAEQPTVAAVLDALSAAGSTWTRADVLRVVCDLTPVLAPTPGARWAAAVENAVAKVVGVCAGLDPEGHTGPTRASDGRSPWLAPIEPHLTTPAIVDQEERILAFVAEAHRQPPAPSQTVERDGLDVLQADAAGAVAGGDRVVLVVGPAGTGKTTALRRAAEDLARHGRPVFGVAPTAKAAKVLHDETGMNADTVAKLLYEWRSGHPRAPYMLTPATTLVVDESGMVGTDSLDQLIGLAGTQGWRLVLVGDPRQLHAVGRGGMFDELCRTNRVHELATIHRFRHRWEQTATLQLRRARPDALDSYFEHDRVDAGDLATVVADITRRWIEHHGSGRSLAVSAETNEHVAVLNESIQRARGERGQLGPVAARIAEGATATVGDIVVTRRNDRALITDHGEPVRNRERWTVAAVHDDGALTVSQLDRHGTVTLRANYARANVQLGYAATAHGHQGNTVDVSLTLVTGATTHRSLYVGATRGRDENRLCVVTTADEDARDVLEHVLTNDRVDVPAVAQRRALAEQARGEGAHDHSTAGLEQELARARHTLTKAERAPELQRLNAATTALDAAQAELRAAQRALRSAPLLRRRGPAERVKTAEIAYTTAADRHDVAAGDAAPHVAAVEALQSEVERVERELRSARLRDRFDQLEKQPPSRSLGRAPLGR